MLWKQVFPDYAVKQAFHEANLDRGDEHVITAMQADLLTRCIFNLLKGALIHCISKKRKYISERDIDVGVSLSIFPSKECPTGAGPLLNAQELHTLIQEHIILCTHHLAKNMADSSIEKEYKMSHETFSKLQQELEANIRGFVYKLSLNANGSTNLRQFENLMGSILGDASHTSYDHIYSPYSYL